MKIIEQRAVAKAQGQITFTCTRPCKRCKGFERYTVNMACVACQKVRSAKWSKANPLKARASVDKWLKTNRGKHNAYCREAKRAQADTKRKDPWIKRRVLRAKIIPKD